MKNFYTISEVANFFNISRQTLLYYDQIGIFKPAFIDEKNGYRFYSREQFSNLSFIISLKKSGFSLNNIKEYFKSRNPKESLLFLEEKILDIDSKINELLNSKETIKNKINELNKIIESDEPTPIIKELDDIKIIPIKVSSPYDNLEYEKAYLKLKNIIDKLPFKNIPFFSSVSKKNIIYSNNMMMNSIGAVIPIDFSYNEAKIFNGGTFVTMKHIDIYDNIKFTYYKILDFIEKNNYKIIGDSREISSNAILFLGKGAGSYMEIQVPVKKK